MTWLPEFQQSRIWNAHNKKQEKVFPRKNTRNKYETEDKPEATESKMGEGQMRRTRGWKQMNQQRVKVKPDLDTQS